MSSFSDLCRIREFTQKLTNKKIIIGTNKGCSSYYG